MGQLHCLYSVHYLLCVDLDECRLKVARQLGASHTVAVDGKDSKTLAHAIVDTLGCQPDRTFECSGAPSSIATAIYVCVYVCVCV